MSEAELLEGHNRQDNLRITQIPEEKSRGDIWQKNFEDCNQSFENVLKVAEEVGALVETSYISIAHKLPARNSSSQWLFAFVRKYLKNNFCAKKKKNLNQYQSMSSLKMFDDLTAPRLNFINQWNKTAGLSHNGQEKGVFLSSAMTVQCIV